MRVRWTTPACRDLIHICDYSGVQFGAARARRTALQIHGAVDRLLDFPHLGRSGRKTGTHELVIAGLPFVEVYQVRRDVVEILRIPHGVQSWP